MNAAWKSHLEAGLSSTKPPAPLLRVAPRTHLIAPRLFTPPNDYHVVYISSHVEHRIPLLLHKCIDLALLSSTRILSLTATKRLASIAASTPAFTTTFQAFQARNSTTTILLNHILTIKSLPKESLTCSIFPRRTLRADQLT